MSGLAALFHRDGRPVFEPMIRPMLAAVPYLGVDGVFAGAWGSVGLGIARTFVTVEDPNAQQPVVSPRTGCVVVADARLDNREDLLAELPSHPPSSASDAELILLAYEAWAERAPAHLFGDYAFVVWDPTQRRMTCARDTSGARSLYYRLDGRTFAAASEIHQLLQDPSVTVTPNEDRIREYLTPYRVYRNDQEQAATFFEGIFTVPAGRVLTVDESTHRIRRYWEFGRPEEIRYRRSEEYVEHFRQLFLGAVVSRLRTSHPMGALLSGGMDSTSVVSSAHHLYEKGVAENHGFTSYSMIFEGLECDESRYIQDVQAKWGFDARFLPAPDFRNLNLDHNGFLPQPMKCPVELDLMLEEADRDGVRTVLTGLYGDNCFASTPLFFDSLLARGRFAELLRYVGFYRKLIGASATSIVGPHVLLPMLPLKLQRRLRVALARKQFEREQSDLMPRWMPEGLAADLRQRHLALTLEAERARRYGSEREDILRCLYPVETVPLSRGHSAQILRPFADRRLHQFLLAIPPEQHFAPHPFADNFYAGAKLILRRAMNGILPESVRAKTEKPHFASVVTREFQIHWSDFEASFGPGTTSELAARGYVDPSAFWERLQRLRDGQFAPDGVFIMRMLNLETWLRTFQLPTSQRLTVPSDRTRVLAGQDRVPEMNGHIQTSAGDRAEPRQPALSGPARGGVEHASRAL